MMKSPLFAAALAAILAQPALADDRAWCRGLAAHLRQAALRRPGAPPQLDDLKPYARPEDGRPPTDAELATWRAGGADIARALEGMPEGGGVSVGRLRRTPFTVVKGVAGTMHCEDYVFLSGGRAGPARLGVPPPQLDGARQDGDSRFCWDDWGWYGLLDGQPAFAEEGQDVVTHAYSLDASPWRRGRWGGRCRVSMRFAPVYRVTQSFHPAAAWPALEALAPRLARLRDKAPLAPRFRPPASAGADMTRYHAIERLLPDGESIALPTFGGDAPSMSGMDGDGAVNFPLRLGGRTYLARLGRGTLGWRVGGDYVLGVWGLRDGKLAPMAGVYVERTTGRLTAFRVSGR